MSNKKSFIAKIEEVILGSLKLKFMDSAERADDFLKNPPTTNSPNFIFKTKDFNGIPVYAFGDENAENTILYIHGGAYVNEINYQHLLYCFLLSRRADAYVLAPVYPLAPKHDVSEAYGVITEVYGMLRSRDKLIVMGDSAGGGFVYSLCQYLKTIGLPQPDKTITFSPWVDISMSNPPYDSQNDPILGDVGLKKIGKSWAGDLSTHDYRVSPLFGDNAGLADTVIFVGTGEIFYADVLKYVDNLKRDGVNVRLHVGDELFHIYPLFPIPEAVGAFKEVKNEIIG